MQVNHALSLSAYQQSFKQCYEQLKKIGAHKQWHFYGDHAHQEYQSKVSDYNPLNIHMIEDMISLCQLLINRQIQYKEVKTREFSTGKPYYAAYQKAEMIFILSQL